MAHTKTKTAPGPSTTGLWIGTYNIRDGQGLGEDVGLIAAIRAVEIAKLDLATLTETKISNDVYTKNHLGYNVECTTAQPGPDMGTQGGIALVYREAEDDWHLEST